MSDTALPPPDPAAGEAAEQKADQARAAATEQLKAGTMTLEELFQASDAETEQREIGHMHVKHALEALPKIGETKADEILRNLNIPGDRHLDTLGSHERTQLIQSTSGDQG